jgi:hypothetical protein
VLFTLQIKEGCFSAILNFISIIIYKSIGYDKYANLRNF